MMYADRIEEKNCLFLRNLNISANTAKDTWYSGTGYGFHFVPYEKPLCPNHYYYLRFTYKFTTTNQSPTWSQFYIQGGMNGGANIDNPVANTEYTASSIKQITVRSSYPLTSGTLYNGNSNAINGVTSYYKNVLIYDVTELYDILSANGSVTNTTTLQTWCDKNLAYNAPRINYDISSLINNTDTKITIKGGAIIANQFVECDGMQLYSYSDQLRNNTYFDNGVGISIYNNKGNGSVTHTRVDAAAHNSPFRNKHKYVLKITTNGEASPGAGGFLASHNAGANKVFVEKFVAKIPIGYTVSAYYNPQGDNSSITYLTDMSGTGDWKEYGILYKCGSSGSFSNGGHVAISGSNNTSVTWYLAYVNNCDITGKEYLKSYNILPNKFSLSNEGVVSAQDFYTSNLLPNGNCAKQESSMLPSGWLYDTDDKAGEAYASIVQPVGASSGFYGGSIKISPTGRYKISYWIKCKGDMSSFLTAISYYKGSTELSHTQVVYVPSTKTQLKNELKSGDTTVVVNSNANWIVRNYSRLGFRNNLYNSYYNDKGTSNDNGSAGIVSGITGSNTINLAVPYSGSTMPVGTVIVESYDGGTYPYPIGKSNLPTDNTWKYVEGYFGAADIAWDGASSSGWAGIPSGADSMMIRLNLYANNGTVPIKYSDIRVEQVDGSDGARREGKIQMKGVD